ncbi:hypothetical protein DPMN_156965 [Dreissena polymorpha]|uniref:Uncharacterized protein n=1 Tax=Dreissena polymorpha TaxID=45954 RepID=A0A9D4FU46_DREPO|nr:hypothetical protein DPMN_156965 [Dreissena polymorpha]
MISLTKFYEDWTINVTSRVLTRKHDSPPCGHVFFLPTGIIFELIHDIIGKNLMTKFHGLWTINNLLTKYHDDRTINVASREKCPPPLGRNTNLLTKFHLTINVASRVLTRQMLTPHDAQRKKRRSQ